MQKVLLVSVAIGLLLSFATASADTIVKPNTFTAGTPADADQVNANFDTVYDQVNKVGAAINVDQPTGNVGIGMAPTANKLDVNGAVSATSFSGDGTGITGVTASGVDWANVTGKAVASIEIVDGTIQFGDLSQNGCTGNQVMHWNGASWSCATLAITDLVDATFDGSSLFLGLDSGANDDGTANENTGVGFSALSNNTFGYGNTAFGNYALFTNTTGYRNTATGSSALYSNTTGMDNTATGVASLSFNTTGYYNTASGSRALQYNTIGSNNSAHGMYALYSNTSAGKNTAVGASALQTQSYDNGGNPWDSHNTAVGFESLYSNQPLNIFGGNQNTAIGSLSLRANTYGSDNTASGFSALFANTTGYSNTANGVNALAANVSGFNNTAVGVYALSSNTNANNTAIGAGSLYSNTSGTGNTAGGTWALQSNTTGSNNTANGIAALTTNTTAGKNTAVGASALQTQSYDNGGTPWDSHNTAVGNDALLANQPTGPSNGINNTAMGSQALTVSTTGFSNTATGFSALSSNTTGSFNTAIGNTALDTNITGSYNTAIGNNSDVTFGNLSNATAIGSGAQVDASDKVRIGNVFVTEIEGQVAYSYPSDERLKKDIEDTSLGLDFIKSLRPVEFRMKTGNDRVDLGFIAQDIEALLGTDYNVLGIGGGEERRLSLKYTHFIAPIVRAMQEQQEIIENQQFLIESLLQRIEALETSR